MESQLICFKA